MRRLCAYCARVYMCAVVLSVCSQCALSVLSVILKVASSVLSMVNVFSVCSPCAFSLCANVCRCALSQTTHFELLTSNCVLSFYKQANHCLIGCQVANDQSECVCAQVSDHVGSFG